MNSILRNCEKNILLWSIKGATRVDHRMHYEPKPSRHFSFYFKRIVTPHLTFQTFTAQRTPHTVRSCPYLYSLFIEIAILRSFCQLLFV